MWLHQDGTTSQFANETVVLTGHQDHVRSLDYFLCG